LISSTVSVILYEDIAKHDSSIFSITIRDTGIKLSLGWKSDQRLVIPAELQIAMGIFISMRWIMLECIDVFELGIPSSFQKII
jgi:hypothetical protein